jgi:hypothetical protein
MSFKYNVVNTPNKFDNIEKQLIEIRTFLNNVDNVERIRIGSTGILTHIENILERLRLLDGGVSASGGFAKLQTLINNLVKDIIGPESLIKYDTNQEKYVMDTEIQTTISERIDQIVSILNVYIIPTVQKLDNVNTVTTVFDYYNERVEEDDVFVDHEGVKINPNPNPNNVDLFNIDRKQNNIVLGQLNTISSSNVEINGNLTLEFNNLTLIKHNSGENEPQTKNVTLNMKGIKFHTISNNNENYENEDISIDRGLRFIYKEIDGNPALIIRKPYVYSNTEDMGTNLIDSDIILYFGTEYLLNALPIQTVANITERNKNKHST